MPSIINIGSMAATGFGFTKVSIGGASYFLGQFTYPTTESNDGTPPVLVNDSSNNIYVACSFYTISTNIYYIVLLKLSPNGTIIWQQKLYGNTASSEDVTASSIAISSSGYIAVGGQYTKSTVGTSFPFIALFNNSGTLQFANYLQASYNYNYGIDCKFDSSNNIYLLNNYQSSLGYDRVDVTQFNSSGTKIWDYYWSQGTSYELTGQSIVVDSNNKINVATAYSILSGHQVGGVLQVNSTGTTAWEQIYGTTSNTNYPISSIAVGIDSSNNVYAANQGGFTTGGTDNSVIAYNSSGTTLWTYAWSNTQTTSGHSQNIPSTGNGATDPSGNTFVFFQYALASSSSTTVIGWSKINSSGTLQFARYLNGGTNNTLGYSKYSVSATGDVYFGFNNSAVQDSSSSYIPCIAVMPSDGSGTGTYMLGGASYTYGTLSLTARTFTTPFYASNPSNRNGSSQTTISPTTTSGSGSLSITTVTV